MHAGTCSQGICLRCADKPAGGAQNLQQAHTSAALAAMMQGSGGPDGHNPFEALLGQPFLGGGGAPPMPDLTTLAASVEGARLLPHPPNAPAVP